MFTRYHIRLISRIEFRTSSHQGASILPRSYVFYKLAVEVDTDPDWLDSVCVGFDSCSDAGLE